MGVSRIWYLVWPATEAEAEKAGKAEGEEGNMDNTFQRIFKILYACDDDNDFAPEDAGDADTMDAVPEETAVQN